MRTVIKSMFGMSVLAVPFACEVFTAADPPAEDTGAGAGSAGSSSATGGDGGSAGSTGTGAPCSDTMPCGTCAHCEQDVCVADSAGTACGEGMCDGAAICSTGELAWVRAFGQTGQSTMGRGIDVDANGQVMFTGYYLGSNTQTLAFDEQEVGGSSVNGDANIFAVALDAATGTATWAADIGSGSDFTGQFAEALVADRARGGAWVAGHYAGTFVFDGWSTMSSNAGNDILVGRVSSDGTGDQVWTHNDTAVQETWALATDGTGRVGATGVNSGRIGTDGREHVATNGQQTAFALLLDDLGSAAWVNGLEHSGSDRSHGHGVAVTTNAVWVGGSYVGSASAVGDGGATLATSGGTESIFLARFDRDVGDLTALDGWGTATGDQAIGAVAASPNGITIAGSHSDAFDLGGLAIAGNGVFVAWVDDGGQVTSAVAFAATGTATVHDVAVDAGGSVVVAGSISAGELTFGSVRIDATGERAFIAKLGVDGMPLWAYGSDGQTDSARGVAVYDGAVYVTGHTDGGFFGSSPDGITGAHDVFVARIEP